MAIAIQTKQLRVGYDQMIIVPHFDACFEKEKSPPLSVQTVVENQPYSKQSDGSSLRQMVQLSSMIRILLI